MRFYKFTEERKSSRILENHPETEPATDENELGNKRLIEILEADDALGADVEPGFDGIDEAGVEDLMDDAGAELPSQYGMDVDTILAMGVEPVDAIRFVNKCLKSVSSVTAFHEVYGRGGLCNEAETSCLDVKGLRAMDFATEKDDGTRWEFSQTDDRRAAWDLVLRDQPDWIVGAPP